MPDPSEPNMIAIPPPNAAEGEPKPPSVYFWNTIPKPGEAVIHARKTVSGMNMQNKAYTFLRAKFVGIKPQKSF